MNNIRNFVLQAEIYSTIHRLEFQMKDISEYAGSSGIFFHAYNLTDSSIENIFMCIIFGQV